MLFIQHHLVMILVTALVLAICASWWRRPAFRTRIHRLWLAVLAVLSLACMALDAQRIAMQFPPQLAAWVHGVGLTASMLTVLWWCAERADRLITRTLAPVLPGHPHHPTRRDLIRVARGAVYAAPAVVFGYGTFIERGHFRTEEIDLPVAGLPRDLDGLRIVQITDLHMGAYLSVRDMERIVGMANETSAHLAIMTGDLITAPGDPLDECIRQLARVRADGGMIGCLGNHEAYARVEDYVQQQAGNFGIRFLRSEQRIMEFRGHKINFAGVDYQRKGDSYLVNAESLIEPGLPNILLSHNPDVFPVAQAKGFAATLSGHTHGGQITVEYLHQYVNPARFYTRYVSGLYQEGRSSIYVSRGLGTVGLPVRIGARPELTLIRLRVG